jgi:hypothetical protein
MKPEKLFNKAQAHVMRNWKIYAAAGVLLLLWVNRENIAVALGLKKEKPKSIPNDDPNAIAANSQREGIVRTIGSNGAVTETAVTFSQAVIDYNWYINYYYENWNYWPSDDAERCKIASTILKMSDNDIIVHNQHYLQTYKKSIYQAMMDIFADPCSWGWSDSDYDLALKKLQSVTSKQA